MKKISLLLISCMVFQFINAQNNKEDSAWLVGNYYKKEQMIPMRDGKQLYTALYIPKDTSVKHPILFNRTPYSCSPYGASSFSPRLYSTYWINYLKMGYIIAIQDVRGRYMSEGDFVDVRPFNPNKKGTDTDEASDTYDAIDWMVKNVPANNGRVGVFGISYPGFYSTLASMSGHPALKAVSPQAPVTDWFIGDDFHHNGALMLMDGFGFYSGFGKPRPKPSSARQEGYNFGTPDSYDFYLRKGALKNLTALMGDSIQFWKDLMSHPNYDDWWKARNTRNFADHVKPAMLVVGGLFDAEDCFGAWNLYKALEGNKRIDTRLVMGPWFHGAWGGRGDGSYLGNIRFASKTSEYYQQEIEIPFFNFYLTLRGTVANIAEANIFFSGENQWHRLKQWPPVEAQATPYYFNANNTLTTTLPAKNAAPAFTEYTSDPAKPVPYAEGISQGHTREYMTDDQRFASRRPDVISFSTGVLTEDITLGGPVLADLKVSLSTTDADFVVKVIDVFPDDFTYNEKEYGRGNGKDYPMGGYQMMVRGEIMRGKFRNSFERPEPFVPGKLTDVKFALPDVAHTFKKGHRIMIQVQSSWFPLADRNPQKFVDIYHCNDSDFQKAQVRIFHDGSAASQIILPVIK